MQSKQQSSRGLRDKKGEYNLPVLNQAQSLPSLKRPRQFNLRFVNEHMPQYNPNQDKFLNPFFQRLSKSRAKSSGNIQKQILKTQPIVQEYLQKYRNAEPQKKKDRRVRLTCITENSDGNFGLKELSKIDFNNYLQKMKEKLSQKSKQ